MVELAADEDGPKVDREKTTTLLDAIRGRELIHQQVHSAFAGTNEYLFRHAILRDVTYETVLLKLRRVYHAQVAAYQVLNVGVDGLVIIALRLQVALEFLF